MGRCDTSPYSACISSLYCGNECVPLTGCLAAASCSTHLDCGPGTCVEGYCTCPSGCGEECGNGLLSESEDCDDGNTTDGDGCSSTCTHETPSCELIASGSAVYSGDTVYFTISGQDTSWEYLTGKFDF
ncbi:MAG: hypothetical protein H6765_10200 [Candidatus Peribacteria bacterium]|nr:MAG: hypothetical protein H6765_10200 [Candidatus Peribacteria bacterium]